jgi:N-acetylglutamate synthase-like GNAT family acetyltransferase
MIRPQADADREAVRALLAGPELTAEGLEDAELFVLDEGGVLGAVGLERRGEAALLRSLAVVESARARGHGAALLHFAIARARAAGVREVFAITTSIDDWLERLGFAPATRHEVPEPLTASAEFRGACPASARIYRLPL